MDHLLPLADEEFSVWRSVCVRTAGLPYDWLADPETAGRRPFLEALTWQHQRVGRQARRAAASGRAGDRSLSRTLAIYRSRYCTKNDSIGFFGPVAWGSWGDGATTAPVAAGATRGAVYFEMWAIQAVGAALLDKYDLGPWVVPRLAAAVELTERGVHLAEGSWLPLSPHARDLAAGCDGFSTVSDLAASCAGDPARNIEEIGRLQAMGVLSHGFTVVQERHPERRLAIQLARVADPARRTAAQNELGELVRARDAVAEVVGDPDKVAEALVTLHAVFTEVTGRAARRQEGEYYAGRSIVYEDCPSPVRPVLGAEIREAVAPALGLLLRSARWFSAEIVRRVLAVADEIVGDSADAGGFALSTLLGELEPVFRDSTTGPVGEAAVELRRRWTKILLGDGECGTEVVHEAADLRAGVDEMFDASEPGWPTARWHSPDLMLAAADADALERGQYLAVLGELHPTILAVDQLSLVDAHPDQRSLRRWIDADMPHRIVPLYPMRSTMVNSRTAPPEAYHSPQYTYLGVSTEPSYAPSQAEVVAVGGMRVHREAGHLVVRSPGSAVVADLVEVLDDYLAMAAFNRFDLLEPAEHRSRVRIGNVVVARERWQFPVARLPHTDQREIGEVVATVRRLAEQFGLPEVGFWSVAGQLKPIYVDLGEDTLVDALWTKLRRARERAPEGSVSVTEMLPGPDELWLRDREDRRYTAEFRITCVDHVAYQSRVRK